MSNPEIKIRKADVAEVEIICSLGRRTFYEAFADQNDPDDLNKYLENSFNAKKVKNELQNPDSSFFLAEKGEEVTGYMKVNRGVAQTDNFGPEYLEVERLYVINKYKGTGIGSVLMKKAFELAHDGGYKYIWLGVWEYNGPAKLFYEKLGFEKFGTHVFQLGDDPQTDELYRKSVRS